MSYICDGQSDVSEQLDISHFDTVLCNVFKQQNIFFFIWFFNYLIQNSIINAL